MKCRHMPEIGSPVFFEAFNATMAREHIPVTVTMELTTACNLRCVHCYIRPARLAASHRPRGELTTREVLQNLDAMARAGTFWILFTGGEPLLRDDFPQIYMHAKRLGIIPTLFTNATLVTPQIAALLGQYPPDRVEVTVHSMNPPTFDRIAGVPGAYERCLRGIRLLRRHGVTVALKTVAMTLNRGDIPGVQRYARQLGAEFRFDTYVNARFNGDRAPTRLRLPVDEAARLELADPRRRKTWRRLASMTPHPSPETNHLYVCAAGRMGCHVDSRGGLSPCIAARSPRYSLQSRSFSACWRQCRTHVRNARYHGPSPCRTCAAISFCGQCPGEAKLEHGNPEQPVPYLCLTAMERLRRLGVGIVCGTRRHGSGLTQKENDHVDTTGQKRE